MPSQTIDEISLELTAGLWDKLNGIPCEDFSYGEIAIDL